MRIAIIVGSLRRGSLNKMLAGELARLGGDRASFEFLDIDLPLYNQDLEADFPAAVRELKEKIQAADGVLIATPEYNRSFPGVLKNAIDWTSRPAGDNPWRNKPVAVVGATPGLIGTALAQAGLRAVLGFLNAKVMMTPELYLAEADKAFDRDGHAAVSEEKYLSEYIAAFTDFVIDFHN
jgi:chromate reductase